MKFSQIVAYLALGATAAYALPTEAVEDTADVADVDAADFGVEDFNYEGEGEIEARDNLPGLNALQSKYARAIIGQAKKDKVGAHGCQAGIATAMVEVRFFPQSRTQNFNVMSLIATSPSLLWSCTPTRRSPSP